MSRCICCNGKDSSGLINQMCVDCFDLSLDVGKPDTKEKLRKKQSLERRRIKNGYYARNNA